MGCSLVKSSGKCSSSRLSATNVTKLFIVHDFALDLPKGMMKPGTHKRACNEIVNYSYVLYNKNRYQAKQQPKR